MEGQEAKGIFAALRREPGQAVVLLKLSAVTAVVLIAWDVLASWALPVVAVKAVVVLILLAYGAAMAHRVARLMSSSDDWAAGSKAAVTKLATRSNRHKGGPAVDLDALRRRPEELPASEDKEAPVPLNEGPEAAPASSDTTAFNESYFLMRLQEQVKDARRDGHEMSVAAIHITLPGREMTPDMAQAIAYAMARLASGQAHVMSPPLAMNDCEFLFSLARTGASDTKQFVRDIARAFGEYWCHFGIATFPQGATNAQDLIERARAACETSLQSGKRGQVEYASA